MVQLRGGQAVSGDGKGGRQGEIRRIECLHGARAFVRESVLSLVLAKIKFFNIISFFCSFVKGERCLSDDFRDFLYGQRAGHFTW